MPIFRSDLLHAHMLRHACGYAFTNKGHDTRALQAYLGDKKHPAHRALHLKLCSRVAGSKGPDLNSR